MPLRENIDHEAMDLDRLKNKLVFYILKLIWSLKLNKLPFITNNININISSNKENYVMYIPF